MKSVLPFWNNRENVLIYLTRSFSAYTLEIPTNGLQHRREGGEDPVCAAGVLFISTIMYFSNICMDCFHSGHQGYNIDSLGRRVPAILSRSTGLCMSDETFKMDGLEAQDNAEGDSEMRPLLRIHQQILRVWEEQVYASARGGIDQHSWLCSLCNHYNPIDKDIANKRYASSFSRAECDECNHNVYQLEMPLSQDEYFLLTLLMVVPRHFQHISKNSSQLAVCIVDCTSDEAYINSVKELMTHYVESLPDTMRFSTLPLSILYL